MRAIVKMTHENRKKNKHENIVASVSLSMQNYFCRVSAVKH